MKNKKLYIVFLVSLIIFLFLAFIVYKHNYISNYELKIINFIQKNIDKNAQFALVYHAL